MKKVQFILEHGEVDGVAASAVRLVNGDNVLGSFGTSTGMDPVLVIGDQEHSIAAVITALTPKPKAAKK